MQNTNITYQIGLVPEVEDIIQLYRDSGIKRPVDDPKRVQQMHQHSNLIITAWHENELVGIARSLSDFCYCTYLSDLAVVPSFQKHGIGKRLIDLTREQIGAGSSLILVSAPDAMNYYPKVGFEGAHAFIIKREPY